MSVAGPRRLADAWLAVAAQSTYVRGADGYYSRLCRVQPPVRRRNRLLGRFQRSSAPPKSQREPRGRKEGRFPGPGGVRSQALTPRGTVLSGGTAITGPGGVHSDFRRALRRRDSRQQPTGGPAPPDMFQTGRRLMRQTVLPSQFLGPSAPMRSDSSARRRPRQLRMARRLGLRFGLPLTPESGGPSRHPSAQSAPAAKRARRLQEFQNAEQNVDRCHPPGGDPGCRGPWQSRRRV
jgi:hypothetical protein